MGELRCYRAFGLVIASDHPLPLEAVADAEPRVDVLLRSCAGEEEEALLGWETSPPADWCQVHEMVPDFGSALRLYRRGPHRLLCDQSPLRLLIDVSKGEVVYGSTTLDLGDFGLSVERGLLPLYRLWRREPLVSLHASAVCLGGQAWVFAGFSGAGKSTTVYEMVRRGARLLSDDQSLIDTTTWRVMPGSPVVRLWRGAGTVAEAFREGMLPLEGHIKGWFQLGGRWVCREPVPLAGVIFLQPLAEGPRGHEMVPLSGKDAVLEVLQQSFDLTNPPHWWRLRRFRLACALAARSCLSCFLYRSCEDGSPSHVEPLWRWLESRTQGLVVAS